MIKDRKKLPSALVEKQDLQRKETNNKVLRACADIRAEGKKMTISALVEFTGLSRSTFAKPHIGELLAEHGYVSGNDEAASRKQKKLKQFQLIMEKDNQIAKLRTKNVGLEKECELLRG